MDTSYRRAALDKKKRRGAVAKPLSPFLYLRRNPGKTLPIGLIILLSVGLVVGIVALLDSISLTIKTIYGYNREFAALMPRGGTQLTPELRDKIEDVPGIGKIYETRVCMIMVKTIVGKLPFAVFGLQPNEMEPMVKRVNLRLGEGRFPRDGEPEVVLSETIVRNLKVKLGDVVLSPESEDAYAPMPVKLVGILKGNDWFALTSHTFVEKNYLLSVENLLILAEDQNRQRELDTQLDSALKNTKSRLFIYADVERETEDAFKNLFFIVNICIGILVLVISIMMGLLANIYFTQRMVEFGLLQAIGYTRRSLLWRVTVETVVVVIVGWVIDMIVAYGGLLLADKFLTTPRGLLLDPTSLKAYKSTLPIPVCICLFAFITTFWRLRQFDPVAIVERRLV